MILVQENGALKAEIELMKEKLEQTIKLLENMEINITKLKATIKTTIHNTVMPTCFRKI